MYKQAWKSIDWFRAERGKAVPDWPPYVFAPLAAWYSIVSAAADVSRLSLNLVQGVARLAAIGTWRVTQGIYRFDPDLLAALWETPITGDLPVDILHRLPEWCVYVETPGREWIGNQIYGFWAHLEQDMNHGHEELRLLLDIGDNLIPVPIHLVGTLDEGIQGAMAEAKRQMVFTELTTHLDTANAMKEVPIKPLVSLVLYLCAENAEIGDGHIKPKNPVPKKIKSGLRLFQADRPTTWNVGVRIGAALRRAKNENKTVANDTGGHASQRPHIRRAHWHTFRIGHGRADSRLKWLPPIPVNVESTDQLPATIHKVKD